MAKDTRDRLISATGRLLRRQGYAATGLNQVTAEAEAPKGSMYFHFPRGKEQLAAAAVDRYGRRVADRMRATIAEADSVAEAVDRILESYVIGFERSDYRDGCAVGTVAVESLPDQHELNEATDRALKLWTDVMAEALEVEGHAPDHAHRLATLVVAVLEGCIVMTRGRRSTEPLASAREALRPLLAPPGAPAPPA